MTHTGQTMIPPSGQVAERLAEIETEARALRRLLRLALDREQEKGRRAVADRCPGHEEQPTG